MLLTTFREFRDNFAAEVWKSLGYGDSPEIFTAATEAPVLLWRYSRCPDREFDAY